MRKRLTKQWFKSLEIRTKQKRYNELWDLIRKVEREIRKEALPEPYGYYHEWTIKQSLLGTSLEEELIKAISKCTSSQWNRYKSIHHKSYKAPVLHRLWNLELGAYPHRLFTAEPHPYRGYYYYPTDLLKRSVEIKTVRAYQTVLNDIPGELYSEKNKLRDWLSANSPDWMRTYEYDNDPPTKYKVLTKVHKQEINESLV